ncbi:MAG: hypothetical protein AAF565_17065, partial [Pseudomonadota bacterium]
SLGGASAVQMTLVDTAEHYEQEKTAAFRRATVARQLMPAISAQQTRFERLQEGEVAFGTFSGSPGQGKVSEGFGQVATLLATLLSDLKAGLGQADGLQGEIATIFSTMKEDAFLVGPLRPRVRRVSVAADQMDDLLERLHQFDYRISIQATLGSLQSIFPAPEAAKSGFEAKQNTQLGVIAEMTKPVAEDLQAALTELSSVPEISAARVRPEPAIVAIRTKWRPLFFNWLAAAFINLAPALLLIILIAAFAEIDAQRRDDHQAPDTPSDKKDD